MRGYALDQYIQQPSEELLHVEEGSLSGLATNAEKGPLKAEWEISPSNRRVRTYRITNTGIKRLEREVLSFEQMLKGISLVLSPTKP